MPPKTSNETRHIHIDQGMNGEMSLIIDGDAVVHAPTREDVARLENKIDNLQLLMVKLTEHLGSSEA